MLGFTVTAGAYGLQGDGSGNIVQMFAPTGIRTQILTVNSTIIDMSKDVMWEIYSPTACKVKILPTNAKGTYPNLTIPVTTRIQRGVNKSTPFINFTGCTNGELLRQ